MSGSHEFAQRYREMPDAELVALARAYETLTDTAQAALREEFAARRMEPPLLSEAASEGTELVTIRRYRDLSEGIVARSLLESAGVHVELRDENLIRLDWQVSNFIGGLRLQVYQEDVGTAVDLLDGAVVDPVPFAENADFEQPHCPRCGSTEISFEGASRAAPLASLYLLSLPLPPGRETWLCSVCHARWTDDPEP